MEFVGYPCNVSYGNEVQPDSYPKSSADEKLTDVLVRLMECDGHLS